MPIKQVTGDILSSGASFIVIPVNTVGVMGAGLAKQVKPILMRKPQMKMLGSAPTGWAAYLDACSSNEAFKAHQEVVCYAAYPCEEPAYGAMFVFLATKQDWRNPSRLEWVKAGLASLRRLLEEETPRWTPEARTVAVPALGCGLGGLCWGDVEEAIENALGGLDKWEVACYVPDSKRG